MGGSAALIHQREFKNSDYFNIFTLSYISSSIYLCNWITDLIDRYAHRRHLY